MYLSLNLILTIYIINIIAIFIVIYLEKRNLSVILLWIVVLLFFPIIGFIFYYIFGSTAKIKLISKKYTLKEIEDSYSNIINKVKSKLKCNYDNSINNEIVKLNNNNHLGILTNNNKIEFFYSADDKYKSLFEDIKNAKESINIEYYTFRSTDSIGKQLISLLEEKVIEGVKVKIIYDRFGSNNTHNSDFNVIIKNGGVVEKFLPSLFMSIITLNYRLHRKMVIIDNNIIYTGGINIGDEYLNKYEKIKPWRDTSIKIVGNIANIFTLRFLIDLNFVLNQKNKKLYDISLDDIINKKEIDLQNKVFIQLLSNGPHSKFEYVRDSYIKIISNSKNYVYMQTPYLAPGDNLLNMIIMASQYGIDVRIIIPGLPDKKIPNAVSMSYAEELIKYGVKIYLYNGFIHSKMLLSDNNIMLMGTSNIDEMSYLLNYEDDIVIYDENATIENKNQFMIDIKNSTELKKEDFKKGLLHRIKQIIVRLISPIV